MTRSPAQDHMAIQHLRLPELARILRNLFVTEKKSILPLDFALEKLGNSYREKLSKGKVATMPAQVSGHVGGIAPQILDLVIMSPISKVVILKVFC
jgi:chromatin licensing and DNA replication factor 1